MEERISYNSNRCVGCIEDESYSKHGRRAICLRGRIRAVQWTNRTKFSYCPFPCCTFCPTCPFSVISRPVPFWGFAERGPSGL